MGNMRGADIGVVVPTLNSAKTLEWTLLSLKKQEGCSVNTIVVDSGSTDETLEICAQYNVRTEYEPPGNMYRAINKGMSLLDTTWITYINSDDIVHQDSYTRLIELGNRKDADVVYGHSDYIDWYGRFIFSSHAPSPILLPYLVHAATLQFVQPSAIFRKVVYEELKGFSEKYRSIADFDFFSRAVLSGKRFRRLSSPTVTGFRLHSQQFSRRENGVAVEEISQFLKEWTSRNPFIGSLSLSLWRLLNVRHYLLRILRAGVSKSR